jgi:hypothetical protein
MASKKCHHKRYPRIWVGLESPVQVRTTVVGVIHTRFQKRTLHPRREWTWCRKVFVKKVDIPKPYAMTTAPWVLLCNPLIALHLDRQELPTSGEAPPLSLAKPSFHGWATTMWLAAIHFTLGNLRFSSLKWTFWDEHESVATGPCLIYTTLYFFGLLDQQHPWWISVCCNVIWGENGQDCAKPWKNTGSLSFLVFFIMFYKNLKYEKVNFLKCFKNYICGIFLNDLHKFSVL